MSRLRATLTCSLLLLPLASLTAGCAMQVEAELNDGVAPVQTVELPLAPPTGEARLPYAQPTIAAMQTANALPPPTTQGDSPEAEQVLRRWRDAIEPVLTLRITQELTELDPGGSGGTSYPGWDIRSVEEVFSISEQPEKGHYRVKVNLADGYFTIVYNDRGAYLKASWHPEVIRPWPDVQQDGFWDHVGDISAFHMLRPQTSLYSYVGSKEVEGRRVTELEIKSGNSGQTGMAGTRILLDEATWLPHRITWYALGVRNGNQPTKEVTFTRLEVNVPLDESDLALELPERREPVIVYAPPHWGEPPPTYKTAVEAQHEVSFALFEPGTDTGGGVETLAFTEVAGKRQPVLSMNNRSIYQGAYIPTFDFGYLLSTARWGDNSSASVQPTHVSVDGRPGQLYDYGDRVRLRFERDGTQIQVNAMNRGDALWIAHSLRPAGSDKPTPPPVKRTEQWQSK